MTEQKSFTNTSINMSTIINKFLPLLNRRRIIIAACLLIVVGYLLMSSSGGSPFESLAMHSDQSFNPDIFSVRRIVIAPILCLAGYVLIVVGILYKK